MVDRCAGCTGLLRAQSLEERKAVHLLPCCIACTGPAPVSLFFNPRDAGTTGVDGISCQEAAFRGRRLVGTTLELPAHFSGLVLEREAKTDQRGEDVVDTWSTKARFSQLTYWNHDAMPSSADPVKRCVDWLRISDKLHQAVSEQQVASMLQHSTFPAGYKRKS